MLLRSISLAPTGGLAIKSGGADHLLPVLLGVRSGGLEVCMEEPSRYSVRADEIYPGRGGVTWPTNPGGGLNRCEERYPPGTKAA